MIAYQIRQSFKPGEVTPEEANQLGYEFARRFTKGDHAFIVCTHTDKSISIITLLELHYAGLHAEISQLLGQHRSCPEAQRSCLYGAPAVCD